MSDPNCLKGSKYGLRSPCGELGVDLRQRALQHRTRRHPAQRHAFTQPRQFLLNPRRERRLPGKQLLDLGAACHRRGAHQVGEIGLEAAERADGHAAKTDE